MVCDLELLFDIKRLKGKRVIVFGAGGHAAEVLKRLKYLAVGEMLLCDTDENKKGSMIEGVLCRMWSEEKEEMTENTVIILSVVSDIYQNEIIDMITQESPDIPIYSKFALEQSMIFNIKNLPDSEYKQQLYLDLQIKHTLLNTVKTTEFYKHQLNTLKYFTFNTAENLIILQPAKVGSSSVLEGFRALGKSVLHLHDLSVMEYNHGDIRRYCEQRPLKIITLVREPIARQISLMFQVIGMDIYKKGEAADLEIGFDLQALIDLFMVNFKGRGLDEFVWFDHQIRNIFDIDVFEHDFNREQGYSLIQKNNVEMLLIKMEQLNSLETVIGAFAGVENFRLVNCNIAKEKKYRFAYEQFVKEFEIPDYFVDYYYKNNPRMDHFYTEEEKAHFLKKWRKH